MRRLVIGMIGTEHKAVCCSVHDARCLFLNIEHHAKSCPCSVHDAQCVKKIQQKSLVLMSSRKCVLNKKTLSNFFFASKLMHQNVHEQEQNNPTTLLHFIFSSQCKNDTDIAPFLWTCFTWSLLCIAWRSNLWERVIATAFSLISFYEAEAWNYDWFNVNDEAMWKSMRMSMTWTET